MNEIEGKILEVDKNSIIEKIVSYGGEKVFEGDIKNYFYSNSFGEILRLRILGDKKFLTYKKRISDDFGTHNIEYETSFENLEAMKNILFTIGFNEYRISGKTRISYIIGNIHFDIDKYENIPCFVEVESNNKLDFEKGVKLLGYNLSDIKNFSETTLKQFYLKK